MRVRQRQIVRESESERETAGERGKERQREVDIKEQISEPKRKIR